jgi:hypothetical protein
MIIGLEDRVHSFSLETWLNLLQTFLVLKIQVFWGVCAKSSGKFFQTLYRPIAHDGVNSSLNIMFTN